MLDSLFSPLFEPLFSAPSQFKGAGVPAPYPPPSGYRWEYVTESTETDPRVFENGERVVELVSIAA